MALALSAGDWVEQIEYPAPAEFPGADAWLDAFFAARVRARAACTAASRPSTTRRSGRCG